MVGPMAVLGGLCVLIGALPALVAPVLERALAAWLGAPVKQGLGELSPLRPVAWVNALLVLSVLVVSAGLFKAGARFARGVTWDCGYAAPTARMQYTASSFADWLVGMSAIVLRPRVRAAEVSGSFPALSRFESHVPDVVLDLWTMPVGRALARVAGWFRFIQHGSVHLYVLYVLGVYLFKQEVAPGWASLSLQIAALFFFVFLNLVLLSEYVVQILEQSQDNPLYHVEDDRTSAVADARRRNVLSESTIPSPGEEKRREVA